jgi:glycosyltransferase involved in cell wall biosynthesis
MPTFNRASLIKETILSCLQQTHQNFELIIVDGKSTDGTSDVMSKILDPRIHFIESDVYLRRSKARNIGLGKARGEYISFIDSDDLLEVNKLSEDIRLLKSDTNAGAIYTSAKCIDESNGKILGFYMAEKSGDLYDEFAFYLPLVIATSQITITRDVLNKVGLFDEELDRFEDTDYFRRISRETKWLANSEKLVILKNHSDNVISNQSQSVIMEMIDKYVDKTKQEIKESRIQTKATPSNLYLYYAQAFMVQKNGLKNAMKLYYKLLRSEPLNAPKISMSILKMTKANLMRIIKGQ